MARPKPTPTQVIARFWSKVDRRGPDECWPWLAGMVGPPPNNYGRFWTGDKKIQAHVFAWTLRNGPLPDGKPWGLHRCDNPPCCNPAHIFPGTPADNTADEVKKGRHGTRTSPERQAWGDRHWSRLHPERLPRGLAHKNAKLSDEDVVLIRHATGSQREIASRFGIAQQTVSKIRTGEIRARVHSDALSRTTSLE